jgi:hypothetical protein
VRSGVKEGGKQLKVNPVVDKILKRAAGWRGKLLNHAAMLELVKSILGSLFIIVS